MLFAVFCLLFTVAVCCSLFAVRYSLFALPEHAHEELPLFGSARIRISFAAHWRPSQLKQRTFIKILLSKLAC
jgi:hypothetical protein